MVLASPLLAPPLAPPLGESSSGGGDGETTDVAAAPMPSRRMFAHDAFRACDDDDAPGGGALPTATTPMSNVGASVEERRGCIVSNCRRRTESHAARTFLPSVDGAACLLRSSYRAPLSIVMTMASSASLSGPARPEERGEGAAAEESPVESTRSRPPPSGVTSDESLRAWRPAPRCALRTHVLPIAMAAMSSKSRTDLRSPNSSSCGWSRRK